MEADYEIDITTDNCPMTFVRTKLAIEKMKNGEILAVTLMGEEPRRNIPRAVRDHGHEVIDDTEIAAGTFRLLIKVNDR